MANNCPVCVNRVTLDSRTYICKRCNTKFTVYWQIDTDPQKFEQDKTAAIKAHKSYPTIADTIHIHEFLSDNTHYRTFDQNCPRCKPWWNTSAWNRVHNCKCCNPVK